MFILKVIAMSVFAVLEFFTAWTLFRAALYNNLPTEVARAAYGLGGCTVAMTILIITYAFRKQPDQLKRSRKEV
ncbi:MAG: hypothetical protein AAB392_00300 [Patescibacteria group bacterium]|mgnify:CR=1